MDSFYIWHKWSLSLEGVSRVTFFSESGNLKFWQIFETFRPWPWKKKSTILDGFFPYLTQMITCMRRCVAYNDLWPWPISSRLLGLDLENRVLSVASTVLDGFFPYVVQMITSMRRCVACDDLWPWPISSRSFGLDLENHVLSVASTVLDGFFPYLVQMISSMRRCVACDDLWPWPISSRSFDLDFENRVRSVASTVLDGFFLYLAQMITIIRRCVACYVFSQNLEISNFGKFLKLFGLDLEKKIYNSRWFLSIFNTNDH